MINKYRIILFLLALSGFISAQEISFMENIELGKVHWLRNYDDAIAQSKESGKDILILFQEVPGCITCRNYGQNVLSHPLIVEALETYFIPLCIHNNKSGRDEKVLKSFLEPSWNNPVVRIIDCSNDDRVKRLGNDYSAGALVARMNEAIIKSGKKLPLYLSLLESEMLSQTKEVYFSMYCFWAGEKNIGKMEGVVATEAGFMHGKEVVRVKYNRHLTDAKKLESKAAKVSCADMAYAKNDHFRTDKEIKYYLQKSKYKSIPMTAMQAMKVNVALAENGNPEKWLSSRQVQFLSQKKDIYKNNIGIDIIDAWNDDSK